MSVSVGVRVGELLEKMYHIFSNITPDPHPHGVGGIIRENVL
jgi:hypothetical protein